MKRKYRILSLFLAFTTAVSALVTGTTVPIALSAGPDDTSQVQDEENPNEAVISVVEADTPYSSDGISLFAVGAGADQNANPPLSGAEFTIKFYAGRNNFTSASQFTGLTPTRTWIIRTDETGYTKLDSNYLVAGSDPLYYSSDSVLLGSGRPVIPLGAVTVQETKAPKGYNLNPKWSTGSGSTAASIVFANCVLDNSPSGATLTWVGVNPQLTNSSYTISLTDPVIKGGVSIEKLDYDQPNQGGQGAGQIGVLYFAIYNENTYPVVVEGVTYPPNAMIYKGQTDDKGRWSSATDWLPYGNYRVVEWESPEDYTNRGIYEVGFSITEATQNKLVEVDLINKIERGAIVIRKGDDDRDRWHEYMTLVPGSGIASNIPQGSGTLANAVYRIRYANVSSNLYPIVVDGKTYQKGQTIDFKLITDATGYASTPTRYLPLGTYEVYEEVPATGYKLDNNFLGAWEIIEDGQVIERDWGADVDDPIIRGGLEFTKIDIDLNRNEAQGAGSIEGAVYTITNRSANGVWVLDDNYNDPQTGKYRYVDVGQVAFTLTTDAEGKFSLPGYALPYGHYEFKEKTPSKGYLLNTTVYYFDITTDGQIVRPANNGTSTETPIRGGFKVQKRDNDTKTTTPQGDATLGGYAFSITNLNDGPVVVNNKEYKAGAVCYTGYADNNGYFESAADLLPYGTYRFTETTPPTGYYGGTNITFTFTITRDGTIYDGTQTISNPVQRFGMIIYKRDIESKQNFGLGGASLAGAEFELINKSVRSVWIGGKEYAPNAVIYKFVSDENGNIYKEGVSQKDGDRWITVPANTLPYGTYLIRETKAPTNGYKHEGVLEHTFQITSNGSAVLVDGNRMAIGGNGSVIDLTDPSRSILNQVYRGDFYIRKIDGESQKTMAGVQFRVTSLETGESHLFTTDENGEYRSSSRFNLHSQDTNGGQSTSGMWFGQYKDTNGRIQTTAVNDSLGALPYGTYVIEELRCDANDGYRLWSDIFTITRDNDERGDDYEVSLNNIENFKYKLSTYAFNTETDGKIVPAQKNVAITDIVTYENLEPGKSYTLISYLYNATTGEMLRDSSKNPVTKTTVFTPKDSNGQQQVVFFFDADGIVGGKVVVYQYLYETDTNYKVAAENDPDNADQTVYIPSVTTTAIEKSTGYGIVGPNSTITIQDTVYFAGLEVGHRYTIKGIVYDRTTGQPYLDASGNQVTASKLFRVTGDNPGVTDGYETLEFTLSAKGLEGHQLVVYEYVYPYESNDLYCFHADIEDRDQMIFIPVINSTVATNAVINGSKNVPNSNSATVVDVIDFSSIRDGLTYRIDGTLHDIDTGKTVATGSTTIVADGESAKTSVTFSFNSNSVKGHVLVVYEKVYVKTASGGWALVATHENDDDLNQRVYVPNIATTLTDSESKSHTSYKDANVTLNDTITYSGLAPNKTYTLKGILVDKNTGNPVMGMYLEQVTATATFKTGSSSSGTTVISFTFSAQYLNSNALIAFEELYEGNVLLTQHKDISDDDQLVRFPEIGTSLVDSKTGKQITYAEEGAVLVDTVTYSNLVPGIKYVMKGVLVDQMNNAQVAFASTEFTPTSENGTVKVTFNLNAKNLKNHTVVAFEELTVNDVVVADHKDVHDEAQSSHIPEIRTRAVVGRYLDNTAITAGTKNIYGDTGAVIVDTVTYSNLIPGLTYTLTGTLMDKDTGESIKDSKGKAITATKTFTPQTANGETDLEFVFDAGNNYGKTMVVFERLTVDSKLVADHEDLTDEDQTIYVPGLETVAVDGKTGLHMAQQCSGMHITDTVYISSLEPGKYYTIRGTLIDKDTNQVLTDNNGRQIIVEKQFYATAVKTTVVLDFEFENFNLAGKTIVVFEELIENGFVIGSHKDINDESQTVHIPKIETVLTDNSTGMHIGLASDGMTVTDTITYSNLIPGIIYKVSGELVDSETGEILATNSITFRPDAANGTVQITYVVDSSKLEGRSVVAYEEFYAYCSDLVASHKDINDENQTVHIPGITTYASKFGSDTKLLEAGTEVVIEDVITYTNLLTGNTYNVIGKLMDVETGRQLDEDVSASFTASSADGKATVKFTVDTSSLEGHRVVLFETITLNGKAVAVHNDLKDLDQTVYVPKIDTVATDANTGLHMARQCSGMSFIDTVTYSALEPGKTYTLRGTLMDKGAQKVLTDNNGKTVVVEKTFTAVEGTNDVVLEFNFENFNLAGKTIVIFEELLENGKVVASHEDYNDEDQTIYVPKIATSLTDNKTSDHISLAEDGASMTDVITYSNLIPGIIYQVRGELVDAMTGENVASAVTTFTPSASSGVVTITYTVEASKLAGRSVVAYEEIYAYCTDLVARHADITDADQTVRIPGIVTYAGNANADTKNIEISESAKIKDTITYVNLIPGLKYSVTGTLIDAATGEQIGEAAVADFVAPSENGIATMTFTCNTLELAGRTLVLFETITLNGKVVAEHKDIKDLDQTVYLPDISTSAAEGKTGLQWAEGKENLKITDIVTYEGLEPGKTYTLTGHMSDKDGNRVSDNVSVEFKANHSNGTQTLTIPVNARTHLGEDLIAFEILSEDGYVLVRHEDVDDEAQTIHIPLVTTIATDAKTEGHLALSEQKMTFVDTVAMFNLQVGAEYELITVLVNRDTAEIVQIDGSDSVMTVFVADAVDMVKDVTVSFESDDAAGSTYVFYEYLRLVTEDSVIDMASHADTSDEEQTIRVPLVTTSIIDATTRTRQLTGKEYTVVRDTVTYSNLIPGYTYTVEGVLVNKSDGTEFVDVNGNTVTGKTTFVAEAENGTVVVEFELNTTGLAGSSLVCFETVTWSGKTVALHQDVDDEDQTLRAARIFTVLHIDENKSSGVGGKITIVDDIYYYNFLPGYTYRVSGTLMDKKTGEVRCDRNGNPYTGTVEFVASETGNGLEYVEFVVDTNDMPDGAVLVAFERVQLVLNAAVQTYMRAIAAPAANVVEILNHEVEVPIDIVFDSPIPSPGMDDVVVPSVPSAPSTPSTTEPAETTKPEVTTEPSTTKPAETTVPEVTTKPAETTAPATTTKPEAPVEPSVSIPAVTAPNDDDGFVGDNGERPPVTSDNDDGFVGDNGEMPPVVDGDKNDDNNSNGNGLDDDTVVDDSDMDNEDETVVIKPIEISTVATGEDGVKYIYAVSDATIVDAIYYKNLRAGEKYKFVGALMNWQTYEPLMDAEGNPIVEELEFIPEDSEGMVEMTFEFDSTVVNGGKIVVFQSLYHGDDLLFVCDDWLDADETVDVVLAYLRTEAKVNESKEVVENEETVIVDTVSYSGLKPDDTYVVKGSLYDWETGKPLDITAEVEFIASGINGSVDVTFTLDTEGMAGRTIVVFEDLYHEDSLVAYHRDINDAMQSILVKEDTTTPKLATELTVDGEHEIVVSGDWEYDENGDYVIDDNGFYVRTKNVLTFTDTLTYTGFKKNTDYIAEGRLVVKSTGEVIATSTVEFTTEEKFGTVEVVFEDVDVTEYSDELIVAMEVVKVKVVETDSETGTVVEETEVSEQPVGSENTETPEESVSDETTPVASETDAVSEVTTSESAVVLSDDDTESESGTVDAEPEDIDAENTEVSYRYEVLVAHEDIEDWMQTVHVEINRPWIETPDEPEPEPEIDIFTRLRDYLTGVQQVAYGEDVTLVDTVHYSGLDVDVEYTLTGVLVNKADRSTVATAEMTFIPDAPEGTVEMMFEHVDTTAYVGATFVAFEQLSLDGEILATHADINDEDQSAYVGVIDTVLTGKDGVSKNVDLGVDVKIVDLVKYENLIPGETYTATAYLRDKADDETRYIAYQTLRFTPESSSGAFEVVFTLDTTEYAKHEFVMTEDIYLNSTMVVQHADMNDIDQTVVVQSKADVFTGIANNAGYIAAIFGVIALVSAIGFIILNRKVRSSN